MTRRQDSSMATTKGGQKKLFDPRDEVSKSPLHDRLTVVSNAIFTIFLTNHCSISLFKEKP
jgi:hypothetical protein